jgi:hypothetical protein
LNGNWLQLGEMGTFMDSKSFFTRRGLYLVARDVTNEHIATHKAESVISTQEAIVMDMPLNAIAVDTPIDALAVVIGKLPS